MVSSASITPGFYGHRWFRELQPPERLFSFSPDVVSRANHPKIDDSTDKIVDSTNMWFRKKD